MSDPDWPLECGQTRGWHEAVERILVVLQAKGQLQTADPDLSADLVTSQCADCGRLTVQGQSKCDDCFIKAFGTPPREEEPSSAEWMDF